MDKIMIKNLNFSYGNEAIFDNVNLEIKPGITKIIGKNGSGKSTFLKILCKSDNKKFSLSGVGKVVSVADYIKIPNDIKIKDLISQKMHQFFVREFPDYVAFINEHMNKKIHQLSTGQQRLFEIFFALSTESDVLILDEVTNGLDQQNTQNIINLINDVKSTKYIFFVSHHLQDYLALKTGTYLLFSEEQKAITNKNTMTKEELVDFFFDQGGN